jgi:hypothetical protein
MFIDELREAIGKAPLSGLHELSTIIWKVHRAGHIDDATAQGLAELANARRLVLGRGLKPIGYAHRFRRAKPQRSPDKAASIDRRRHLAASCPMPPALAAGFTTGELAVLKIVADECQIKGFCDRSVAELAARAGVCETTVRNAIRAAELDHGMINVRQRPRPGAKNLTNIIRIIRAEWLDWLAKRGRRPAQPIGCKKVNATAPDLERGEGFKDRNGIWRPKGSNRSGANRAAL